MRTIIVKYEEESKQQSREMEELRIQNYELKKQIEISGDKMNTQ